jgi:GH24 family phage-related lysozyme (muramidase)/LysM repeat protein
MQLRQLLIESAIDAVVSNNSFLDYIKTVEGSVKNSKGMHYVYDDKDPSNPKKFIQDDSEARGVLTIGYGHTGADVKPGMTITEQQATKFLIADLKKAAQQVIDVARKYGVDLTKSAHQLQMLTDFAFNLGVGGLVSKFPIFLKSVLNNDWQTMRDHYKRYTDGSELSHRNNLFFNKFLSNVPADVVAKGNIGKTLYPTETEKYTNVRSSPEVNTGLINNLDAVVKWPNKIGKILDATKDDTGKIWYNVQYTKDGEAATGWVRSDVVSTAPAIKPESTAYTVKRGDTLTSIAKKYKTTADRLKRLNKLTGDNIKVGQQIKLK